MKIDMNYVKEFLVRLMAIKSPAGDTDEAIDFINGEFKNLHIGTYKTKKGALIATIKGKDDDNQKTISAHVDTLGAIVKEIKPNGRLKFAQIGGFAYASVEGENLVVKTLDEKEYTGTALPTCASVHIFGDAARETVRNENNMEVRIDENVKSKEDTEKLGIRPGDFIYFDTRTEVLESGYIKSRYLDDKAAVAIVMGMAKYISDNKTVPKYTTNFFISNYEEVNHGVSAAPEKTQDFIAIDIGTVGENQNSDEFSVCICARDAFGPYNLGLRKKLVKIAENHNLDYKIDLYNKYGSDATASVTHGFDFNYALVGPGVDATHHYERTHVKSLENTMELLLNFINE